MKRRVVITGLGAVTALGEGAETLWKAALEKRSGIDTLSYEENWKTVGAFLKDFEPEKYIEQRKSLKVMARDIQLAVAGAKLAMDDSNLNLSKTNRERFGVVVGSGVLNHELDELAYSIQNSVGVDGKIDLKKFGQEGLPALFPLWLLKYLPNMSACHISILFNLEGPNNTVTTGASASLQAIGEAYRIIERGSADLILAGGAESKVNPVGVTQYEVLGVLSTPNGHAPKEMYRPFDMQASGIVVGEGSGFLLLEELDHAKKRKAKIYAEVAGFGSSWSQGHAIAMRSALQESRIQPSELGYIQAAGVGIPAEDLAETDAIFGVFNSSCKNLFVSASKPITGFTGFSAGALDLIISTLSLQNQMIPPTMNFDRAKRALPFQVVKGAPIEKKIKSVMTNCFGFNGQCASIITKKFEG